LVQPQAEAVGHGAITIVNAMATGKGAAVGINLWTKARVTLTNEPGSFEARNLADQTESTQLIEVTARHVLNKLGYARRFGAIVETQSNIPIAVGLKSSSAAANAVSLACVKALGKRARDLQVIRLGVEGSLKAGVTLTGAYDDACACYLGGVVVTDNSQMRIIKRFKPKGRLRVLIHVPNRKKYTRDIDPAPFRGIRLIIQVAHREAVRGNYWNALTLNGLAYSNVFHYDTTVSIDALNAGALAAGLSGKGPAVAAVVPDTLTENVRSAWRRLKGVVLETNFNFRKATVRRVTA